MIAPEWFPRPNDGAAHEEDLICAICSHEWIEWILPAERAVACPACGYRNELGRV